MILIKKSAEPSEWTKYRLTPGVDFNPIPELRDSLYREQGYICAYCMRRIPHRDMLGSDSNGKKTNEDHRIEHILCQELHDDRKLDYKNLVICCPGHIGTSDHCDRAKGNNDISFSPMDETFIRTIAYSADGTIKSSNSVYDDEMNRLLNLNDDMLRENRKSTWKGVLEQICQKKFTKGLLTKQLSYYKSMHKQNIEGNDELAYKPYCGIVIYNLQKKLKQMQ
jgi:uncharacterized protein (TIGR02646 family)